MRNIPKAAVILWIDVQTQL